MASGMQATNKVIRDRKMMKLKAFLSAAALGLIFIFIAAGILLASLIAKKNWTGALDTKSLEINDLSGQLSGLIARVQLSAEQYRNMPVIVDDEAVASDSDRASKLFSDLTTWGSFDEMAEKQESAKQSYSRVTEGGFLKLFGPLIMDDGSVYFDDGTLFGYKENCDVSQKFVSFESCPIHVSDYGIRYVGIVTFDRTFGYGSPIRERLLVFYTVYKGRLSNFSGYYITESAKGDLNA